MLRRCLLVTCVLLIAAEAHADIQPLIITGGFISSSTVLRDSFFNFSGPFFSVSGANLGNSYTGGSSFGISLPGDPNSIPGLNPPQIVLEGFPPCIGPGASFGCGGFLNFTISPPATPNAGATPFTATGQIFLSPFTDSDCGRPNPISPGNCLQFDLVGQGSVSVSGSDPFNLSSGFGFSAPTPEPSTFWLLGMALIALGLVRRRLGKGKERQAILQQYMNAALSRINYGAIIAQPRSKDTSSFPSLRTSPNLMRRFFITIC